MSCSCCYHQLQKNERYHVQDTTMCSTPPERWALARQRASGFQWFLPFLSLRVGCKSVSWPLASLGTEQVSDAQPLPPISISVQFSSQKQGPKTRHNSNPHAAEEQPRLTQLLACRQHFKHITPDTHGWLRKGTQICVLSRLQHEKRGSHMGGYLPHRH